MPDDLAFRSAVDLAKALRRREIGCRELLEHYVARVERLNPTLNAVITLDLEAARARADEADAALADGEYWGPLHGVPMTIKDTFETMGLKTTCGHPPLANYVPGHDAVAVGRLAAAGAVFFGKTNVPTLAADVQTYNPLFGVTSNPWDASRTSGGSSGGAAAALAAGLTGFELGSDIGGSIRTPASWCGIYGHKPSYRIIPTRGHIPGPPGTLAERDLSVVGPLGRGVKDLALGLDVLVGPLPEEQVAWSLQLPPSRHDHLREYRVGFWFDDPAYPVDGEVRAVLDAAVAALRRAGCAVSDARPAIDLPGAVRTYFQLLFPVVLCDMPDEAFAEMVAAAAAAPAEADDPATRTVRFTTIRHRAWIKADEERQRIRAQCAEFFKTHDVLLMPVVPVAAIPHDHSEPMSSRTISVDGKPRCYYDLFSWIALPTMAYLPATVAPVGRTRSGLPVGVQIVGPYLEDRTTVDFAGHAARVVGGFEPPPLG
ncbi:MAG TPA: amidase [Candidatus Limnocylindria bacterium]|nr:amidase [Candidatus Limnocylindria bacterium]